MEFLPMEYPMAARGKPEVSTDSFLAKDLPTVAGGQPVC